jgi:hypothetical protein
MVNCALEKELLMKTHQSEKLTNIFPIFILFKSLRKIDLTLKNNALNKLKEFTCQYASLKQLREYKGGLEEEKKLFSEDFASYERTIPEMKEEIKKLSEVAELNKLHNLAEVAELRESQSLEDSEKISETPDFSPTNRIPDSKQKSKHFEPAQSNPDGEHTTPEKLVKIPAQITHLPEAMDSESEKTGNSKGIKEMFEGHNSNDSFTSSRAEVEEGSENSRKKGSNSNSSHTLEESFKKNLQINVEESENDKIPPFPNSKVKPIESMGTNRTQPTTAGSHHRFCFSPNIDPHVHPTHHPQLSAIPYHHNHTIIENSNEDLDLSYAVIISFFGFLFLFRIYKVNNSSSGENILFLLNRKSDFFVFCHAGFRMRN